VYWVLGVMAPVSARRRDTLASFEGGIGVVPVVSGAGTANADGTLPNVKVEQSFEASHQAVTRGRIADLKADVDAYGRIRVKGRGLLITSGNSIGQTAVKVCLPLSSVKRPRHSSSAATTPSVCAARAERRLSNRRHGQPSAVRLARARCS